MTNQTSPVSGLETATPEMVEAAYAAYRDDELFKKSDDWLEAVINAALAARPDHAQSPDLREALRFLVEETTWKSIDRDNMEFQGRVTCYQLDKARAALAASPDTSTLQTNREEK